MTPASPTKIIAACLGLCAFAIAIIAGIAADNPLEDILKRAIFSLLAGNIVGMLIGAASEAAVNMRLKDLRLAAAAQAQAVAATPTVAVGSKTPPEVSTS